MIVQRDGSSSDIFNALIFSGVLEENKIWLTLLVQTVPHQIHDNFAIQRRSDLDKTLANRFPGRISLRKFLDPSNIANLAPELCLQ